MCIKDTDCTKLLYDSTFPYCGDGVLPQFKEGFCNCRGCYGFTPTHLFIVGTGGFGREVLWAAKEYSSGNSCNYYISQFFLDDNKNLLNTVICNTTVVGTIEDLPNLVTLTKPAGIICGVGSNELRRLFVERIEKTGLLKNKLHFATIVHPSVSMSKFVEIGEGSVVCAGCILTTQVTIGKHCNLNLDSTFGHDVVVKDFCNISPGCHLSGYVTLEEGVDLGTGVNILPHVTIGKNSVVGAGATVTKDIPDNVLCVGTPAKPIKDLLTGEKI